LNIKVCSFCNNTNKGNHHIYFLNLSSNQIIDASRKGFIYSSKKRNNARFINHSCDPNCHIEKWTIKNELKIGIFSKYDLKKGTELTFDYSFETLGETIQECYCKSKNCRGAITRKEAKVRKRNSWDIDMR
jgi:SET domain-containing protein